MTTDELIIENLRAKLGRAERVIWAAEKVSRALGMPKTWLDVADLEALKDDANELHQQLRIYYGLHDPDPLLTKVEIDGALAKARKNV